MKPIDLQRFTAFVNKGITEADCWTWNGTHTYNGYGMFWYENTMKLAHRVSYEHFIGPLNDLLCCHKCDNPECCNPLHLFAGTDKENIQDSKNKGRFRKLCTEDVKRIKTCLKLKISPRFIAIQFFLFNLSR